MRRRTSVTCAGCGATLRRDATWCGQCYGDPAPVGTEDPGPRAWRPLPVVGPDGLPPTYTRTGSTVTTFGLFGRSVLTLLWFALLWWFLNTAPLSMVIFVILTPWWLRAVWKRARQT